jgi:phospholipid transport system substrate-binding protein
MSRLVFALLCLALAAPGHASGSPPDQIARAATDKIIALVKENKDAYTKDSGKLFAMVDEHVLPHFDFRAMSRSVLGRYWREASEDQRQRFTSEFRDLLVRTYATALLKYNDEQIVYQPFRLVQGDRTATVRSEVHRRDGGPTISINYSFYQTDSGWKVYDVTIEGASLVTTYQSTYAQRVQKEGIDKVIASLAQDNKAAIVGKSSAAETPKKSATK